MNTAPAQHSIQRRPLIASIVMVALAIAGDLPLILARDLLSLDVSVTTTGIVSGAVLSLLGAIAVSRLGLWRDIGLIGRPGSALTLLWFLPFAIYGLLPLTAAPVDVAVSEGIAAAAFGVLIAFWKMVMFGLLLYVWAPRGRLSAVALATVIWSGFHLVGGIVTGARVVPTIFLALSYLFLAFAFGAVVTRTRLLWPLVGCYGLLLATASLASTGGSNLAGSVAELLPAVTLSVLLAIYGVAVWPRRKRAADQQAPVPVSEPAPRS